MKITEVQKTHTRLLRIGLAIEESRLYWQYADPTLPRSQGALKAFEGRWFGNKSMPRVKFLLAAFAERFDAFPEALAVLQRWLPADLATRRNLCHWHTQLTDPLYRDFTSELLAGRRIHPEPSIDRDVTVRWLERRTQGKWSPATTVRMANGLLTAAAEAGFCSRNPGRRRLVYPEVTDAALTYLLYLLRAIELEGTLLENPYLGSLGLQGIALEQPLRRLQALDFRRMGGLTDFGWRYPDLTAWAEHELHLTETEAA
jgi:hypothetical protein